MHFQTCVLDPGPRLWSNLDIYSKNMKMPLELLGFSLTRSDISTDAERYSPFFGRFRHSEGPPWGVGSEVENEKKQTVWVLRMKEKLQGCNSSFSPESQLIHLKMTKVVKTGLCNSLKPMCDCFGEFNTKLVSRFMEEGKNIKTK